MSIGYPSNKPTYQSVDIRKASTNVCQHTFCYFSRKHSWCQWVSSRPTCCYFAAINHKSLHTQSKHNLNWKSKTSKKEKARFLLSFLHVLISSLLTFSRRNNKNKNNTRSNVISHSLSLSVFFLLESNQTCTNKCFNPGQKLIRRYSNKRSSYIYKSQEKMTKFF